MTIIEKFLVIQKTARKNRDKDKIKFISFILGEINSIGKNENRATTHEEALGYIKSFIKKRNSYMKDMEESAKIKEAKEARIEVDFLNKEIEEFIPKQLDNSEIEKLIKDKIQKGANNIGKLMGSLREYKNVLDMKEANKIARTLLN